MKNLSLKSFIVFLAVICAGLSSCDTQKRLYRKGFYVSHQTKPGKLQQAASAHLTAEEKTSSQASVEREKSAAKKTDVQISSEKINPEAVIFPKRKISNRKIAKPDSRPGNLHGPDRKKKTEKIKLPEPTREVIDFAEEKKINALYVAAFICGIVGFFLYFPAVAAVICGAIAKQKEKQLPYKVKRHTLGMIGFVFGIVTLSLLLFGLALVFLMAGL